MLIPLSIAVRERCFSTQNRIKTHKPNRLTEKQLEYLTRTSEPKILGEKKKCCFCSNSTMLFSHRKCKKCT